MRLYDLTRHHPSTVLDRCEDCCIWRCGWHAVEEREMRFSPAPVMNVYNTVCQFYCSQSCGFRVKFATWFVEDDNLALKNTLKTCY